MDHDSTEKMITQYFAKGKRFIEKSYGSLICPQLYLWQIDLSQLSLIQPFLSQNALRQVTL